MVVLISKTLTICYQTKGTLTINSGGYALVGMVWILIYLIVLAVLHICVRKYNWNPKKQVSAVQRGDSNMS